MKPYRNKLLRRRVFERDAGICAICHRYDAKWQHDHIIPLWSGGKDDLENAQTLCRHCHMQKSIGETPVRAKTDRLRERHEITKSRRAIRGAEPRG